MPLREENDRIKIEVLIMIQLSEMSLKTEYLRNISQILFVGSSVDSPMVQSFVGIEFVTFVGLNFIGDTDK